MAAAGRWSFTGMPHASAVLPGAEAGTGAGVDIEGGAELAARAPKMPRSQAEDPYAVKAN